MEGTAGPKLLPGDDPFDKIIEHGNTEGGPLFLEINGEHYCFPCQCKLSSTCYQCSEDVDELFRDKRCRNNTYVCAECLKKTRTNHLWICYADGCMSPGEVAQEEYDIMMMEGETNGH
jgi:hypothetical protein